MLEITYSLVPNSCIRAGASSFKGSIEARVSARYLGVTTEQLPLIISLTQCYNESFKVDILKTMSLRSLECGVCFLRFDNEGRRPIDLGCGHSFCQECHANHTDSFRRCPDCREASVHPHPNFSLLRILAEMEMDRANISMDRALEIMKEAYKAEVERALEAQKVAYKAEMDDSVVAENALQRKVWDSGRTHPDIIITNSQLTIKREIYTTNTGDAVATINCPLTGTYF
jgi:hypothetical protein